MTLPIALLIPALTLVAQQPSPQRPAVEQVIVAEGQSGVEDIACGPASLPAPPAAGLRVSGGYQHGRIMFGPGDSLFVNAGARQGLQKGQVYYARRHVRDMFTPAAPDFTPISIHTAGWVTIVDVKDDMSVAQVTHACDGIVNGDYLEPYVAPVAPPPAPGGQPDYEHPARIVMADETMQTGSAGTLMLINRGSDHGVRAGQNLTIYRDTLNGAGPVIDVGRGTILSVRPQTSLIRVDSSHDAVYIGDMAALHR
jgi:hypothetical protein